MASSTLLQSLLGSLLDSPAVVELGSLAGEKAVSIVKEYFTFTGDEITQAYQDSYGYSLAAISLGLVAPDQKLAFVQKFLHTKVTREFADPIEVNYLQPFAKQRGFDSDTLASLRKQFIEELKKVVKYKDRLFQVEQITEEDLAALISYQDSPAITDLVLEKMQGIVPVDETLVAFLRSDDLLGKAMRFFFREIVRKDDRVYKTQAALQQEGLCIEVRNLQTTIKSAEENLKQAIVEKSSHLADMAQQLQNLQQAQAAWESRSEQITDLSSQFSAWRDLLNYQVEQVLEGLWQVHQKLVDVHDDVKETKKLVEEILQKVKEQMARQYLSPQVKPSDDLTRQDNLKLILDAFAIVKQLPRHHPEYRALSGKILEAESQLTKTLQSYEDFKTQQTELIQLLERSLPLFDKLKRTETIQKIKERVADARFKIMIVGEMNTGKSTLINALLGQDVLPTSATPEVSNDAKWQKRLIPHFKNPINFIEMRLTDLERPKLTVDNTIDAVVFVTSCHALATSYEMEVIEQDIRGCGYEDIFFVCNRFEQIRERERERVRQFAQSKLADKTNLSKDGKGLYFVSAADALDGKLNGDEQLLNGSGMLEFEEHMEHFLVHERGRVKLFQAARELSNALKEAKNKRIDVESEINQIDSELTALSLESFSNVSLSS